METTTHPTRLADPCTTCGDPWSDHDRAACLGYTLAADEAARARLESDRLDAVLAEWTWTRDELTEELYREGCSGAVAREMIGEDLPDTGITSAEREQVRTELNAEPWG